MRLRLIAPVLVVLAVTASGFVTARLLTERDARRGAEHRADIAGTEVGDGIEQAANLAGSLRRFMLGGEGGGGVTNAQFADNGARWLSPVGLPAAAWVEQAPKRGGRGLSLRARLVTGASPMTAPGIDLGGEAVVAAAVVNPRTLFRITVTPFARVRDGRTGIFLIQSAPRLSDGVLEPGFAVLFVPGSWLVGKVTGQAPRLELRIGDTSYGGLGSAAATGRTFSAEGRRFDVLVPRGRVLGAAALLPWLILGAGLVLAALAGTLAAIAERRARAQREVDRIFTLSPDLITVAGFDGFWKRVNPALEELLGYTEREALARPFLDFIHPDDRERSEAAARRLVGGETILVFENRLVCKDGSYRWIEWTATPVPEEDLLYEVGRDVTERRRSESEETALRRVATLVAEGVQPQHLFAGVAEEVARVFDAPVVSVVRYDADDVATECASFSRDHPEAAVAQRWRLDGPSVLHLVRANGDAARLDDYSGLKGEVAEAARQNGLRSTVGAPIVVAGRIWGSMIVSSRHEPLPVGTETRLADFTELLAAAISSAESHEALARLADEQAALRGVAVLVARQPAPDEVFTAVSEAVGRLLGADLAAMHRFPGDGTATAIAGWSAAGPMLPIGTRLPLDGGDGVAVRIFHTGAPARMDSYLDVEGETAKVATGLRLRSTVGAPIVVDGRLWGALMAATRGVEPLPDDAETRIAAFTELVATAVSNAQAREDLQRLADEQAALRRVATLVAQGVRPLEIFSAVSDEVERLFGSGAAVLRFEHDGPAVVFVGVSKGIDIPIRTRWDFAEGMASADVYRTGRSARVDAMDWSSAGGPVAEAARRLGVASTVVTPVAVEGRLWGALSISSTDEMLPLGTEGRLEKFTELVATAIANADSKAELAASRRRIVTASDDARRRIERDLHDGTQQRLVSLGLAVRAAEAKVPSDFGDLRGELSRVATGLVDAVAELQEISRGIHPAILSQGGLAPALRTLARRSAIPIKLDVTADTPLPGPIQVAAYYVASEALANAAKHSQASRIDLSLTTRNGSLLLSIRDDGVGGADPARGSGLVGLTDRVEALGGAIHVQSRAGDGTQIRAELPLGLAADAD